MKLTEEIKKRIDSYFENISPEELYYIAVDKYGFKENIEIEIDNQSFEVVGQNFYSSKIDNSIDVNMPNDTLPLAA